MFSVNWEFSFLHYKYYSKPINKKPLKLIKWNSDNVEIYFNEGLNWRSCTFIPLLYLIWCCQWGLKIHILDSRSLPTTSDVPQGSQSPPFYSYIDDILFEVKHTIILSHDNDIKLWQISFNVFQCHS